MTSLLFTCSTVLLAAAAGDGESVTRLCRVTAYCPCSICCGRHADGVTASGDRVTANGGKFCAADKSLPFGTMIVIPGYAASSPVPVLDRGGAIRGDRLDVFFPTHKQARQWGVKYIRVTILRGQHGSAGHPTGHAAAVHPLPGFDSPSATYYRREALRSICEAWAVVSQVSDVKRGPSSPQSLAGCPFWVIPVRVRAGGEFFACSPVHLFACSRPGGSPQ